MTPRALVGVVALVVATAACGSAATAKATPPTKSATTPTKSATTPTTAKKLNPNYDAGNTVLITATGFQPKELVATTGVPVRFLNHTKAAQRVQFEHSRGADGQLIRSGSIAPGGSWSYTWTGWESATYHSIDRPALRGQIQIQPPAEP